MKLQIVKPQPKFYRLSYATLQQFNFAKPKVSEEKSKTISDTPKPETNHNISEDKYDAIISEAIKKGLIDCDERDMKKMELTALSEKDFEDYVKQVHNAQYDEVTNVAEPKTEPTMTEAELALAKLRREGKTSNIASTDFNENNSRSLADIKSVRNISYDNVPKDLTEDGMSIDLNDFANAYQTNRLNTAKAQGKKAMSNLHGLTKPIMQQSPNPIENRFSQLSQLFTTIGSQR